MVFSLLYKTLLEFWKSSFWVNAVSLARLYSGNGRVTDDMENTWKKVGMP